MQVDQVGKKNNNNYSDYSININSHTINVNSHTIHDIEYFAIFICNNKKKKRFKITPI